MAICRFFKNIKILKDYKNQSVNKDVWLFTSYYTRYTDSPKVVSEYIHEHYPSIKIYWILDQKYAATIPNYINMIDSNDKKAIKEIKLRAQVVVDNITGYQAEMIFTKNIKKRIVFNFKKHFNKRKYQYTFTFWHGTPSKKGFNENDELKTTGISMGRTYFLLGSTYAIDRFKIRTKNKAIDYVLTGTPRNDLIIKKRNVDSLKEKLGLPLGKRVILYAPTFRANATSSDFNIENSGIKQLDLLDINAVIEKFSNLYNEDFIFVTKFHHLVQDNIDIKELKLKYGDKIFFGNCFQDINDYISCSDILITDYSSIMFDYLLTKKPLFLFAHDYDSYMSDRGTLIDVKTLGFPFATSNEELYNCIEKFNYKNYLSLANNIIDKFGFYTLPNATENAVKYIFKTIGRK